MMTEWEKQLVMENEEEESKKKNGGLFVKVMTDEQMEILRKQIAAYATICDHLINMHKSLSPNPHLNLSGGSLGKLYSDPLVTSGGHKITCRQRWTPSPVQLQILEHIFDQGNGTPSKQKIKDITSELSQHGHISETNVYNWFQNRRARSKRKQQVTTPKNGDESQVETEADEVMIQKKTKSEDLQAECTGHETSSEMMNCVDLQANKPLFNNANGSENHPSSRSLEQMSFYDGMVSIPRSEHLVGKIEESGSYNTYIQAEDFD